MLCTYSAVVIEFCLPYGVAVRAALTQKYVHRAFGKTIKMPDILIKCKIISSPWVVFSFYALTISLQSATEFKEAEICRQENHFEILASCSV